MAAGRPVREFRDATWHTITKGTTMKFTLIAVFSDGDVITDHYDSWAALSASVQLGLNLQGDVTLSSITVVSS